MRMAGVELSEGRHGRAVAGDDLARCAQERTQVAERLARDEPEDKERDGRTEGRGNRNPRTPLRQRDCRAHQQQAAVGHQRGVFDNRDGPEDYPGSNGRK